MSEGSAEFFEDLGRRGHEPLLAKVSGTVRFELADGEQVDRWLVAIDKGDVAVSHEGGDADCLIRGHKELIDALCQGEENATAAMLRGALQCRGDVELLFAIQRVFPGPRRDQRRRDSKARS